MAGILLAIFLLQGLLAIRLKSPAFDETGDIAAGLSYVQSGEIRANLQHPPLLKELAGISLWLAGVRLPGTAKIREMLDAGAERVVGSELIAANGPDHVMFWARLPFLLLAAALGAVLWWWGRQVIGEMAALAALFLYTLSPTILGHAYLATLDVGLAAFTIFFIYALWSYGQAPNWKRLALCGVFLGLLLCTKFSALFLLPVAALILFLARRTGPLLLMGLIATLVIQAVYLSPSGLFLYSLGMQRVNADHNPDYLVFLGGQLQHSFPSYFPMAYLLKEPIAAILLAALGIYAVRRSPARWYLLLPPAVIFAAHMALADDLGVRYIIPALPFLYLIGGAGAAWLIERGLAGRIAVGALGAWLIFTSFAVAPDHLSYFNEAAGGPRGGPSWLDDSNVDWGQGLKQLKVWADQNAKGRPIKLFYFGSFPPAAYGWNAEPLDALMKPPAPGLYAVSAHYVARVPAEWLKWPPAAIVGHALYVFDIAAK
jgi:4-amino-4-deoxy-L-arabinose transferase-like glycosyltransferase